MTSHPREFQSRASLRPRSNSKPSGGSWRRIVWTVPLALVAFLGWGVAPSLAATQPFHVMIDPGHGGIDTGAVKGKLKESEIALKVSLKLAELLRNDLRFKVSLTRERNETVTLPERTKIAKDAGADLFLSVHLNSSTDSRVHGKEFYFQNQLPADEEAMFLASRENAETAIEDEGNKEKITSKSDLKRIVEDLKRNHRIVASSELSKKLVETWTVPGSGRKPVSRSIRQAPFYVVSNNNAPSVLVEIGYLTHPHEGPKLASGDYQEELAKSLYNGLVKFKETMDKDRGENINSADAN